MTKSDIQSNMNLQSNFQPHSLLHQRSKEEPQPYNWVYKAALKDLLTYQRKDHQIKSNKIQTNMYIGTFNTFSKDEPRDDSSRMNFFVYNPPA